MGTYLFNPLPNIVNPDVAMRKLKFNPWGSFSHGHPAGGWQSWAGPPPQGYFMHHVLQRVVEHQSLGTPLANLHFAHRGRSTPASRLDGCF